MIVVAKNVLYEDGAGIMISHLAISVEENLGLARKFVLAHSRPLCPVEDTEEYSIACEGLMRACDTYQPEVGEVSTYAYKCMKNVMLNEKRKVKRSLELYDPKNFDL